VRVSSSCGGFAGSVIWAGTMGFIWTNYDGSANRRSVCDLALVRPFFFFFRLWSVHSCDVSTAFIRSCDFASNCMEVTHAWTKASVGATISACGFDEGCNLCDWIIVQPDGIAIE
jgi:hypothetical protein